MKIRIGNFQNRLRVNGKTLTAALRRALGNRKGDVSVAVVTRQKMRAVNRRYLGGDCETDVIAFDLADKEQKERGEIVGEIVISADRAASEARRRGRSAGTELAFYVVHGALHLLGMEDNDVGGFTAMRDAAVEILHRIGCRVAQAAEAEWED